jgi:hypothetical protein
MGAATMTRRRSDLVNVTGFLAFGKDGGLKLVRPDLVHAACCRADRPAFRRCGLYLSGFTFPERQFREHFAVHGRKDWTGPCGTFLLRWDVDRQDDVAAALVDARRLVSYLVDHYALDEDVVLVGLSGSKGYHIEIPFGPIEPADHVPGTLRLFCQRVVDELKLDTFDVGNYDRTRLWRCWNSRHERTGRFKRRLDLDELLHLNHERHSEMAREERAFEPPGPVCSETLNADWQAALAAAQTERQQHRTEDARHYNGVLTEGAWRFVTGLATQPGRHDGCVHAAAVLARAGCPKGLTFDLLSRAANSCGMTRDYGRLDVLRAIENGWRRGRDELERLTRGDADNDSFE